MEKILCGGYVDFTLLLPDSQTQPQGPTIQFRLEDSPPGSMGTPITTVRRKKPVIVSFYKWVDAYSIFMLFHVSAYPRRAVELI